jgi:hypothetical protein
MKGITRLRKAEVNNDGEVSPNMLSEGEIVLVLIK